MLTVTALGNIATIANCRRSKATPARHTITLYDLIAAIQDIVSPEDDALVVATVAHLLRSRRCTSGSASMTAGEHAPHGRT